MEIKKTCIHCEKEFFGRSDKKFCSITCKNHYNYNLRKQTRDITKEIDGFLHRNRIILQTIMGERKQMTIDKIELEKMGFRFDYITGMKKNTQNKIYRYVYDFAYLDFTVKQIRLYKKE